MANAQLQLTLIGPWQAFDPTDPLAGIQNDQVRQDLAALGWLRVPELPDGRLALAATMMDDRAADGDEPLFASVFVYEHPNRQPAVLTAEGAVVPDRREEVFDVGWPTPDIDVVRFRRLTFEIPLPGGEHCYSIAFTTPNLTRWSELEYVFDTIASTAAWVDPAV